MKKKQANQRPLLNEGYHGRAAPAGSVAFFNFGAEQVLGGGAVIFYCLAELELSLTTS